MRVTHVITGLNQGGAEHALYRLIAAQPEPRLSHVVSLLDEGLYGPKLAALGVRVDALGIRSPADSVRTLARLIRLLKETTPDVVQTWMYHADLWGGIAAKVVGVPVCWGVRQSNFDPQVSTRSTRVLGRLCAWSSRSIPSTIVACANEAKRVHRRLGYADKFEVIPNGLNLDAMRPDPGARDEVLRALNLPRDVQIVGHVGRAEPLKDHPTLLRAFARVARTHPRARLLLVGSRLTFDDDYLGKLLPDPELREKIIALGPREEIPKLMSAMDVFLLTSIAEGFPNVVAEALACGVPCVVTTCGDAGEMVGDTGWIRPVGDVDGLAADLRAALDEDPSAHEERSRRARQRAVDRYGIDRMVSSYDAVWRRVAG